MSNYTSTANIVLNVNGRQAQKMLAALEKDAKRLEKAIAKASVAGDKATMKKLQRELNSTNKMIEQLRGSANSVDNVLRRLDKASPKELNRTLKTLQQQLNGIQRGTAAWDAQIAKIKMVKAELQKVNATMATQKSLWSRFTLAFNNAYTAVFTMVAGITGLVLAGRRAVNSFAEIEEAMANTRKYTRMTAEEVEKLNDIFKAMDTRLSREQLNLLAQEGGRLGYHTVQTVKEYVEAASIINVALVDLGEGATQTIAKLSNIFGIEQMYGVRDAMLKVGSTVNHLSQNCAATKPFIVEFAQRLAGIGSTAKMSIPDIMAFAATLDAHGQKVEMSSTALQRTIMALYKKPADMAKKVGLDVEEFSKTLHKSTTEGVMMFLEALHKLGEDNALEVLSPLFQDLGLDGVRVSAVLANLSSHLDFLKWELGEAAGAFRDGTSASNEYAIFNNTVQASIDKAKKRVNELAIELGEKLYPLMKHIYTSSSALLRVLNAIVTFLIENRKVIGSIVTALSVYYGTILAVKTAKFAYLAVTKLVTAATVAWRMCLIATSGVVQLFKGNLQQAIVIFRRLNTLMKTSTIGIILTAVVALIAAFKKLTDRTTDYKKRLNEATEGNKEFIEELNKEIRELDTLFGKLRALKKEAADYQGVKNQIISKYGQYLQGLIDEKGEITDLTKAYNRLTAAARTAAKERSINFLKDAADRTYEEMMGEFSQKLLKQLQDEGKMSYTDAVELMTRIVTQLQATGTLTADVVSQLEAIKGSYMQKKDVQEHPVNTVNDMIKLDQEHRQSVAAMDQVDKEMMPFKNYTEQQLRNFLADYEDGVIDNNGARIIIDYSTLETKYYSAEELKELYDEISALYSEVQSKTDGGSQNEGLDDDEDDYDPYKYETEKERRARLAKEKREAIKARKEFKEELDRLKGEWEGRDTVNLTDFSAGLKTWKTYLLDKYNSEIKYFDDRIKLYKENNLEEDEDYAELLKKKAELQAEWKQKNAAVTVAEAKRNQQAKETQAQMDYYTPDNALYQKEEALNIKLHAIRIKYLGQMRKAYDNNTEEYYNYTVQIEQAEAAEKLRIQKRYAAKIAEWNKKYEYLEAKTRMDLELQILEEAKVKKLVTEEEYQRAKKEIAKKYQTDYMPDSAQPSKDSKEQQAIAMKRELDIIKSLYDQGILSKEEYEKAKARIEKAYRDKSIEAVRKFGSTETNQLLDIYQAWKDFFDDTADDGGNWATRMAKLAGSVFAVMNAGLQQYTEYANVCADLEVAKAEKKYDREIELAEGNNYKKKKLEKEKEKELAKIKNEANRKMYAMQVIQAVAQTATNALNAYGSAAAIPMIGHILAPIAAAMAVAAGALQIATIKKQQQLSEAQGYSEGGFTRPGRKDEPAGVVHAGEWVASQKLVNNPRTRPLLEALDYAQRNNTIGSITAADVSRSVTSPMILAAQPAAPQVIVTPTPAPTVVVEQNGEYADAMRRLARRLDEPFVTVNTVTGDHGINRAIEDYNKLINNKNPKR